MRSRQGFARGVKEIFKKIYPYEWLNKKTIFDKANINQLIAKFYYPVDCLLI